MNKCCLCDSHLIKKYLSTREGDVMKCSNCGIVFLPTMAKTKELYSEGYFLEREDYFLKDGVINNSGIESDHVKDFRNGLGWIESYKKPTGMLLDIGCATGSFLSLARGRGWESYGVEISDYAASVAREMLGLEVFSGCLRDASYPDNFFDVITMWDIIEHIPDPFSELQEVYRILKPDGLFLVNTPNEKSLIKGLAKFFYRATKGRIKSPVYRLYHKYHFYYFNTSTLALLFKRAGFIFIDSRKKVIPITRGRGSLLAKEIVRGLSVFEKLFHAEYELFIIGRKEEANGD